MPPKKKSASVPPKGIEEKLNTIYKDEHGALPDLKRITYTKRPLLLRAFVGLMFLAAIGIVGVAAVMFFFGGRGEEHNDVSLTLEGPTTSSIGSEISYMVRYSAQPGTQLTKARLQLHYPKGFVVSSTQPHASNAQLTQWDWAALEKRQAGEVIVSGTLYGNPQQEQSLRAFFTYEPDTFASEFQQVSSITTQTLGSPVHISVEGADNASAGSDVSYTLVLTNVQEETLEGLTLVPGANERVNLRAVLDKVTGLEKDAKIIESAHGLVLPPLAPAAQWSIPFIVNFNEDSETALSWNVQKEVDGEQFVLASAEKKVVIHRNDFSLQLLVNGKDQEVSVMPGDFLTVSVFYKNNGTLELDAVTLETLLDAPSADNTSIFDWQGLVETTDAAVVGRQLNNETRRGIITWTSRQAPDLRVLEPNEQGVVTFQLPVKKDSKVLDAYDGFQATVRATAQFKADGTMQSISSQTVTVFMNSDVTFAVDVEHDDSNNYIMQWKVDNTWHPLKDVRLSTKLFGDIAWEGPPTTSPGTVSFNERTGALEWKVDSLPLEAGVLVLDVAFKLEGTNPTQTALTDKIVLRAQDAITGKEIVIEHIEIPVR